MNASWVGAFGSIGALLLIVLGALIRTLMDASSVKTRLSNVEDDMADFKQEIKEVRTLIESKHERIRHDLIVVDRKVDDVRLTLSEEKGRNDEKHKQNLEVLLEIRDQTKGDK